MILFISVTSYSQGIQWTTGLSWDEVKQKAKDENKYIFIDVYATWCVPCKQMDKNIYPLAEVGKAYNDKFISIRLQADLSKDKEDTASWYQEKIKLQYHEYVLKLLKAYNVGSYPTFLFFTPTGELVHRATGGLSSEKFIGLANDALRQKGYVNKIDLFKTGQYENLDLKELAISAQYAGEDSLAKAIAAVYVQRIDAKELINQDNLLFLFQFGEKDKKWAREICMPKINSLSIEELSNQQAIRFLMFAARNASLASKVTDYWINKMTDAQLFNKDTLEYVKLFLNQSSDRSFQVLYINANRVDKIMGKKNWTVDALSAIISKEEFLTPIFYPTAKAIDDGMEKNKITEPDWQKLFLTITKKYGTEYAKWLEFSPKMNWYNLTDNKKEYTKYLVAEMDRTAGWDLNGLVLNNFCMDVLDYSINKKELQQAAVWMERYFKRNPKEMATNASSIDTYASLLYKAGQVKKSLYLEEKAWKIDPKNSDIADNFTKMKEGRPIWPIGFDVVN